MIIYMATNTISKKSYIGQTIRSLETRWKEHLYDKRYNHHFYNAIRKYPKDSWCLEILEEVDTLDQLNEKEKFWIEKYNTFNPEKGYNSDTGGKNGRKMSEETRQKCVASLVGRILSEETKEKLSKAHKGKILSIEHRNKISESQSGKKRGAPSDKTRLNIGEAMKKAHKNKIMGMKGKKHSEETKKKISEARKKVKEIE